LKELKNSA